MSVFWVLQEIIQCFIWFYLNVSFILVFETIHFLFLLRPVTMSFLLMVRAPLLTGTCLDQIIFILEAWCLRNVEFLDHLFSIISESIFSLFFYIFNTRISNGRNIKILKAWKRDIFVFSFFLFLQKLILLTISKQSMDQIRCPFISKEILLFCCLCQ